MTQQAQAGPAGVDVAAPTRADARAARRPAVRRGQRAQAVVTALLLLVLFAGDVLVAVRLPVRASTCVDQLCGPALGVAAGSLAVGLVAVVTWLVGDRLRERGRGVVVCWLALLPAAAPWVFVALRLQWWEPAVVQSLQWW